jgi:uncharacterized protein (TIGR00725 family)
MKARGDGAPPRVAVVGGGRASPEELEVAREVGRLLAEAGAVVVTGGLGGVMEAASRGSREAGGHTVGILPGDQAHRANRWVELPLPTGMGEGRNVLVVRAGEAVVAVGGEWGTLSEIALARKMGRPVVTLGRPPAEKLGLPSAETAAEAVEWAMARIGEDRGRGSEEGR